MLEVNQKANTYVGYDVKKMCNSDYKIRKYEQRLQRGTETGG